MASFRDLKEGDFVYSVQTWGRGKNRRQTVCTEVIVSVWEQRSPVRGGLFATLPCYPDGEVYLWFRSWYRRSSGVEYANSKFEQPTDRPRTRLLLEPPTGIPMHQRPEPQEQRRAA